MLEYQAKLTTFYSVLICKKIVKYILNNIGFIDEYIFNDEHIH